MDDLLKKDWQKSIRTDLAIENREMLKNDNDENEIDGVIVNVDEFEDGEIKSTLVKIINKSGEEKLGKPIGNYVTIEAEKMNEGNAAIHKSIVKLLTEKIIKVGKLKDVEKILIVGLGNWNVTPDALGPKVISKILVTRHIMDTLPEDFSQNLRNVSCITPGVMGQTGIETAETVKGIVQKIKPDLVIAIDALAARRTSRINTTIQISDTGINPGSGVGNKRKGLTYENLGIPVLAIGVPTVVDACTLVNDTIDLIFDELNLKNDAFDSLNEDEKYKMVKKILFPYVGNMFVTPKEVDDVVVRLANIISKSINLAIHQGITEDEIDSLMA